MTTREDAIARQLEAEEREADGLLIAAVDARVRAAEAWRYLNLAEPTLEGLVEAERNWRGLAALADRLANAVSDARAELQLQ